MGLSLIYMDNAASAPLTDRVCDALRDCLVSQIGNASSQHLAGIECRRALQNGRHKIASSIGCDANDLIFTSGGTESNNLALFGTAKLLQQNGKCHIVCSSIEHKAVLEPMRELEKRNFDVSCITCGTDGIVAGLSIMNSVRQDTGMVSMSMVNNETGMIQPVKEVCRGFEEKNILVHVDAVQALAKIPLNCRDIGADLVSFSSHKIHGPKGIGALYVKHGTELSPMILGGSQENGLRSGTENIPGIVGFAEAVNEGAEHLAKTSKYVAELKEMLLAGLMEIDNVQLNGNMSYASPYILNVSFRNLDGLLLHKMLTDRGLCISSGSACTSSSQTPSHVLTAMGLSADTARSAVRFSLSQLNTSEEVNRAVACCRETAEILNAI